MVIALCWTQIQHIRTLVTSVNIGAVWYVGYFTSHQPKVTFWYVGPSLHDIYYFVLGVLSCNKCDCLYSSSICKLPVLGSFDIIGLLWCFHQIGFFSFRSCTWAFGYRKKGLSPFGWTKTVQAEYEGKYSYIGHYYQASYGCSLQV
jgi:hypothetical protein